METHFAIFTVIGIVTCFLVGTNGFLFQKTDCLVSAWAQWSAPFGFGQVSRVRTILRYPTNGGAACPTALEEVKPTSTTTQKPTLKSTMGVMVSNDCLVSAWAQWSAPFGFGQVSRERKILRYPTSGGAACPAVLEEVKQTTQKPTLNSTAASIVSNFLKRTCRQKRQAAGNLRDLLIIVDDSGSVTSWGFANTKTQLSRLLGMLCPVPDPFNGNYQRAAVLKYSSTVSEIFDFNDRPSTNLVKQGIMSMAYTGGSTCTGDAFNYAYNHMFTTAKGMRSSVDVKKEVLIITDGQSNCGANVYAAAANLRTKADVFGLMIGAQTPAGMNELTAFVSNPRNTHLFAIDGLQVLKNLVDEIEIQLRATPCAPFDIVG